MSFFTLFTINKIEIKVKKKLLIVDFILLFFIYWDIFTCLFTCTLTITDFYISDSNTLVYMSANGENGGNNTSNTIISSNTNSNTTQTSTVVTHRSVQVNGTWSDTIRTVFIYGTAAMRIQLTQNPSSRRFAVVGAILTDAGSKFLNSSINDPSFLKEHYQNIREIFNTSKPEEVTLDVSNVPVLDSVLKSGSGTSSTSNAFSNFNFSSITDALDINLVLNTFLKNLEPIPVDYPIELLAQQVYGITIACFILCIGIILLFISFIFNLLIVIFRDKLLNYFTNKYIVGYLKLQFKVLFFELFVISLLIFYALGYLAYGLYFLVRHPVMINAISSLWGS